MYANPGVLGRVHVHCTVVRILLSFIEENNFELLFFMLTFFKEMLGFEKIGFMTEEKEEIFTYSLYYPHYDQP